MLKDRERDRDRITPRRDRPSPDRPDAGREGRRDEGRSREGGNGSGSSRPKMSGSRAVTFAKEHLAELTGSVAEGLSSLTRTRDGWRVVLETVELERVPRTTDIMASYAIDLDSQGDLMGYQRIARYYRSDVDGDQ